MEQGSILDCCADVLLSSQEHLRAGETEPQGHRPPAFWLKVPFVLLRVFSYTHHLAVPCSTSSGQAPEEHFNLYLLRDITESKTLKKGKRDTFIRICSEHAASRSEDSVSEGAGYVAREARRRLQKGLTAMPF